MCEKITILSLSTEKKKRVQKRRGLNESDTGTEKRLKRIAVREGGRT